MENKSLIEICYTASWETRKPKFIEL
jgi:hypothetical protein